MEDRGDYLEAKRRYEREHPGEIYTTAMHHRPGPAARVLTDYWEQYDEEVPLPCPSCGWSGRTGDADISLHDELFDVCCPRCERMLLIVNYPTLEQTRAAAQNGNEAARRDLVRLEDRDRSSRR